MSLVSAWLAWRDDGRGGEGRPRAPLKIELVIVWYATCRICEHSPSYTSYISYFSLFSHKELQGLLPEQHISVGLNTQLWRRSAIHPSDWPSLT